MPLLSALFEETREVGNQKIHRQPHAQLENSSSFPNDMIATAQNFNERNFLVYFCLFHE